MPTYDMKCLSCGHEFTVSKSYDDNSKDKCPKCKKKKVRKIISVPSISFRGEGFTLGKGL